MKLAFYYPYRGDMTGGATTLINLVQGLNEYEEIEIVFITQNKSEFTELLHSIGIETYVLPFFKVMENERKEALSFSLFQKIKALIQIFRYNLKLKKLLEESEVDVLITRNIKNVTYSLIGSKLQNIPVIWDIGLEPDSKGLVKYLHYVGLWGSESIVTQANKQPEEIFKEKHVKRFASKFHTIYPGIEEQKKEKLLSLPRRNKHEKNKLKVVCIGTITSRKNQLLLLKSIKGNLKNQVQLDFIGSIYSQEYYQGLKNYIEQHDLQNSVRFLGWRDDVPKLLGNYDLFVLCSKAEGTPQVIREAMFAGLPLIVSNVGGMAEVVEHRKTGFVLDNFDPEKLGNYINFFVQHPEELNSYGSVAREDARNLFSYETWVSSYKALIETCQITN